jgi:hypothetical protein
VRAKVREQWDAMWARRRAGSRARRKYEQQRKEWLRRHRKAWLLAVVVAVAIWAAFTVAMALYPGDQAWGNGFLAGALVAVLVALRQSPPAAIANWQAGAFGEEETAKALRPLEREGWVVLHDLANGSANFDHVVLGPNGVFCLNSKWPSYRLELTADGKVIGRHEYDDDLTIDMESTWRKARGEAAALHDQILARCGRSVWVQPVVVWWGTVDGGGRLVDRVGVVEGKNLAARLRTNPGKPIADIDAVTAALRPGRHTR